MSTSADESTHISEASSQWHTTLHAVIFHLTEPRILLLAETDGWSVPAAHLAEPVWPKQAVGHLQEALRRALGLEATVLRCADFQVDEVAGAIDTMYTVEHHCPTWTPPANGQWIDRATLAALPLARTAHRQVLDSCLAEAEDIALPQGRSPWAQRGWFGEATAWIQGELARLGYRVRAPIEQVKSWSLAAILRAPTTTGDVYFKATAALPLFTNEPVLTAALAARYPGHVPDPLAIDAHRRWMLLPDLGESLRRVTDIAVWETALRLWGQMQRASVAQVDTLLAAGCLDRRLEVLAAQIDPLLHDEEALSELTAADVTALRGLAPRLKALCDTLARAPVPPALVHGDLHGGNIVVREGNIMIVDWSDGCIAHPFFDLLQLSSAWEFPDGAATWTRLRDNYLLQWTDYAPLEQLREVADLAEILAALHHAVSYQHILRGVERAARDEHAGVVPYWLGEVLHAMEGTATDRQTEQ